jgi:hypothetical protein
MAYRITWLDNFHAPAETVSSDGPGAYATAAEAIASAQASIDRDLRDMYRSGMTSDELYRCFVMYGETPIILGDPRVEFSASDYARQRCGEICDEGARRSGQT